MDLDTPDGSRNPGFFFDLKLGKDNSISNTEAISANKISGPKLDVQDESGGRQSPIDCWEASGTQPKPSNSISTISVLKPATKVPEQGSPFELKLLEHLPDSPLCPGNPLQKSGGLGICVYHGRKSVGLKRLRIANSEDTGMDTDGSGITY